MLWRAAMWAHNVEPPVCIGWIEAMSQRYGSTLLQSNMYHCREFLCAIGITTAFRMTEIDASFLTALVHPRRVSMNKQWTACSLCWLDSWDSIWHTSLMKWFFVPVILVPVGGVQERKTKRDLHVAACRSWIQFRDQVDQVDKDFEHAYTLLMQQKVNQTNCIQLMVQGVLASLFQCLAVFQFWLQFKRGRVWPSTLAAVLYRQCGHRNTYAGLWHLLLAGYAIKCQDQKIKKRIWSKKYEAMSLFWPHFSSWQSLEILSLSWRRVTSGERWIVYWIPTGEGGKVMQSQPLGRTFVKADDFRFASL